VKAAPPFASANTSAALRAELAALDAVRDALANGNSPAALSLVATYFRTFPRGRMYPEAEVLRIDALAKAGQLNLAKRHAHEFIERYPNSVLTVRVRPYADR
jgi:outer membrane protein assembly factor BamD (BamD/ComL family)